MSLLNTVNFQINNTDFDFYTSCFNSMKLENIENYITWNNDSINVMYNIIILSMSCFTWCYFITFMTMVTSNKMKISNDLFINLISLMSGYIGIIIFGYYNITYINVAFIICVMLFFNFQMIYYDKLTMIEYAAINSILTTFVNIASFLLLLYKTPSNMVINLNIFFDSEPIVKIIS